jgi:DNA-binding NtrC family response regulator
MLPKPTIIVVDDEDSLRSLVVSELARAGYVVDAASNGRLAISMLLQKKYALAILDIKMPEINGIEVLKYIHDNCPATKTIMLTGFAELSNAMECMRYGAKDFIDKPFNLQDLLSTVERILQE